MSPDEWIRLEQSGGLLDEYEVQEAEVWLRSDYSSDLGYSQALFDLVTVSRTALAQTTAEKADAERTRRHSRFFAGGLVLALVVIALVAYFATTAQSARNIAEIAATAEATARLQAVAESTKSAASEAEALVAKATAEASQIEAIAAKAEVERLTRGIRADQLTANGLKVVDENPHLALLLAVEGLRVQNDYTEATPYTDTRILYDFDQARYVTDTRVITRGETVVNSAQTNMHELLGKVNGIPLSSRASPTTDMAFSPDSHWLVTGSEDNTARLWDMTATDPGADPIFFRGHTSSIWAVAFSPDGHWLATGSADHSARLWDLTASDPGADPSRLQGHADSVNSVAFSPDGRWLATGSADHSARLWDLAATDPSAHPIPLQGHASNVWAVVFSPDAHWLATSSYDENPVRLWDLTANDPGAGPILLQGQIVSVNVVTFSPDGHWLATGSTDHIAHLWDLTASDPGADSIQLSGHTPIVKDVTFSLDSHWLAFSPDGHWLAIGSYDNTAGLWDLTATNSDANPIFLLGHTSYVVSVAFSPDGHWLATKTADNIARLWDLTATDPGVDSIILQGPWGNDLTFSPDGHWLATSSYDTTARLWRWQVDDLIDLACRTAARNLTAVEWQTYLRDKPYRLTCEQWPADSIVMQPLLDEATALAQRGDILSAVTKYQDALAIDPKMEIDPEKEAVRVYAQTLLGEGIDLARQGDIIDAVAKYEKAVILDPGLKNNPISIEAWNSLCWNGAVYGYADRVLDACESAVRLAPDDGNIRDSRGLAYALTGNVAGAIEDFTFTLEWAKQSGWDDATTATREAWLAYLQEGKDPALIFDDATLESLR